MAAMVSSPRACSRARALRSTSVCLARASGLRGDAAAAAGRWTGGIRAIEEVDLEAVGFAIDALFGAGLARDLDGPAKAVVLRLNEWTQRTKRPILAVDVPSGIDGTQRANSRRRDQGRTHCHLLPPQARPCAAARPHPLRQHGPSRTSGLPITCLTAIAPKTFANGPALWRKNFPVPRVDGHKYARGHALVLSGGLAHTGAARLAARGALRAGAGLVTIATPREALGAHAAALTAIMTSVCDGPDDLDALLADRRKNALVMGPALGVGEKTRGLVRRALSADMPGKTRRALVLDADALTSFAEDACGLARLIRQSGKDVVLTPHDGEFARLFGHAGRNEESQWASLFPEDDFLPYMLALQFGVETRPGARRRRVKRRVHYLKRP